MKYKDDSDILKNMHVTITGLYEIGLVLEETMKEFDEDCLAEHFIKHKTEKLDNK